MKKTTISSQKNSINYSLEYIEYIPVSLTCDKCNQVNKYEHIISSKKEYIAISDKSEDEFGKNTSVSDEDAATIFDELKKKNDNKVNNFKSLIDKQNYSLIKYDRCDNCDEIYTWALKSSMKSKIITQSILYLGLVLLFLILNVILKDVMKTIFNNKENFMTSIFFFPSVVLLICIILTTIEIISNKKKYNRIINDRKRIEPIVDFTNIKEEKKIYRLDK